MLHLMLSTVPVELVFEVIRDEQGSFQASCLNTPLKVIAENLAQLHDNVTTAVHDLYSGRPAPRADQIHFLLYAD